LAENAEREMLGKGKCRKKREPEFSAHGIVSTRIVQQANVQHQEKNMEVKLVNL
jgi:hypothetical protein